MSCLLTNISETCLEGGSLLDAALEPRFAEPVWLARAALGLQLYGWQESILGELRDTGAAVALRAANGSGKTSMVAAPAAIWHAARFPGSITVATAGVYRQVKEQLFAEMRKWGTRLHEWSITEARVTSPHGSRIIGFSTDDAGKFEGWHGSDETPLLMIVDEAKTVKDDIFQAIERCQPQRRLIMSSPGGMEGEFHRAFTSGARFYSRHVVTAFDCPHIGHEWIDGQILKWGRDHQLIRSMIFAEFTGNSAEYVVGVAKLDQCMANPPARRGGEKTAFCDFAAGGDENVLAIREGNEIQPLICWREPDTMAGVGRFIIEFKKAGLTPEGVWADEGGLGKPMCDALREAGWAVNRVNNGARANDHGALRESRLGDLV